MSVTGHTAKARVEEVQIQQLLWIDADNSVGKVGLGVVDIETQVIDRLESNTPTKGIGSLWRQVPVTGLTTSSVSEKLRERIVDIGQVTPLWREQVVQARGDKGGALGAANRQPVKWAVGDTELRITRALAG